MPSSFPLPTPLQHAYLQIETATRSFWQQASYLDHGRIQTPVIWERVQRKVLEVLPLLFALAPLEQFEAFLLSTATLLYEIGWQAPGGAEATIAERYRLSGQLIRQSYQRREKSPALGLSHLDSAVVEWLVRICEAAGQEDLSHLSSVPLPGGSAQDKIRPRYLAALLQLADALVVPRQKEVFFSHFRPSAHLRDDDEARLALHSYVTFIPAVSSLTTFMRINPHDQGYAPPIIALITAPLRRWWAANWHWLAYDLQVEITWLQEWQQLDQDSLAPKTLAEVCSALPSYLATYQPPVLNFPTARQVQDARAEGERRRALSTINVLQRSTSRSEQSAPPAAISTPPDPVELYDDFYLHIDQLGQIMARSNQGDKRGRCEVTLPANIRLALSLLHQNTSDAELCEDLGSQLYELLFPKEIHTLFQETEAVARNQGHNLRLRLDIEAESLARLPLEFLYRQDRGHFLAINPRTVLSRYLQVSYPRNHIRLTDKPLHMLLIISSPSDQEKLNIAAWQDAITEALAGPLNQHLLTLDCITSATYAEINRAMLQRKPDLIQFVGHGIYQQGTSSLALMNESGGTWLIDGVRFADMFLSSLDNLGLFCLASCESATSDNPQGFLGVTPQLLQRGVPAVIAMQYRVKVATARLFFSQLYQSVAYRKPIDWAVQQARNAISAQKGRDNREFATPVLYMRAEDGNIF